MSQLLDRPFAAVVLPGADEKHLPAVSDATGFWNDAQRQALGLPTRERTQAARQAAWAQLLAAPVADLLWCASTDQGEALQASPLVQLLALDPARRHVDPAADPRALRTVVAAPTLRPAPDGSELPMGALSATSYDMLRACPYRFYAKHLLGLGEANELDRDLEKRDWGLWVHGVLRRYHEALRDEPDAERKALLEVAARRVTRERGLDQHPGEFLPFKAAWPALRDAYLKWQQAWEAEGARFEAAEETLHARVGDIALRGRLDRIDRGADGQRVLIDYKTEPRDVTARRLKAGNEDTQLAFYALLSGDEAPRAAYLNLAERDEPKAYELHNLQQLAAQLYDGMASDLERIAERAPLLALGEGRICDYCEVRGLCRKDFWS
jgi:ATP-dependent helicase/nuclease subunit B